MQDDIDHFGDVESFLSNNGEDGHNLYGTLKQTHTEPKTESSKGSMLFYAQSRLGGNNLHWLFS